jgi:Ca2+-binding EF-hand superfamily protein
MNLALAVLSLLCGAAFSKDQALSVPDVAALNRESAAEKFKAMDANGDGAVDSAELDAHLKAEPGLKAEHHGAHKAALKPADADKDGKIALAEYLKWAEAGAPSSAQPVKAGKKKEGK